MTATMSTTEVKPDSDREIDLQSHFEAIVKRRLSAGCPYAFYFSQVSFEYGDGVLTLRGRVATFRLRQVLETRLADFLGVVCIDNRVDVVSSVGLSSVRPK